MGTQILTGYTGEAHVTAKRDGEIWGSIWGGGNLILSTGGRLALNVVAQNGTATIENGAFIFSKRIGLVEDQLEFEYGAPENGKYCKVGIAIKYTKDTSTAVESFSVVCEKTSSSTNYAAVKDEEIIYSGNVNYETQIQNETTEAYFVLYEFVVDDGSNFDISNDMVFSADIALTLPNLLDTISDKLDNYKSSVDEAITAEQAARSERDVELTNLVNARSVHKLNKDATSGNPNDVYDLYFIIYELLDSRGYIIASPTEENFVTVWGAAIPDDYNDQVYFPKIKVELKSDNKYVKISASGSNRLYKQSLYYTIGSENLSPTIVDAYGVKVAT